MAGKIPPSSAFFGAQKRLYPLAAYYVPRADWNLLALTESYPFESSSTSATANLNVGTLSIVGFAPTISTDVTSTTSTSSLTIENYTPVISVTAIVETSASSLVITNHTITASSDSTASLTTQSILINGFTPVISSSSISTLPAGDGPLTIVGKVPTVSSAVNSSLASSALDITGWGFAASDSDTAALNTGILTLTSLTATIISDTNALTLTSALSINTFTPTVSIHHTSNINNQALVITGYNPTSNIVTSYDALLDVGAISITTFNATTNVSISTALNFSNEYPWYGNWYGTPSNTLHITGYIPTAGSVLDITSELGFSANYPWYGNWYGTPNVTMGIQGYAPTVAELYNPVVITGDVNITGHEPLVDNRVPIIAALDFKNDYPWYGNWYGTTGSTLKLFHAAANAAVVQAAIISTSNLTITPFAIAKSSSTNVTTNFNGLNITGHIPVITLGNAIIANIGSTSYNITGRVPTLTVNSNLLTDFTKLDITGYNPSILYTLNANIDTQSLGIIGYNTLNQSDVSLSLNTTRQYQFTPSTVFASVGVNTNINASSLVISGKSISYQFGTTSNINTSSLIVTSYTPTVISTNDIVLAPSLLDISELTPSVKSDVSVATLTGSINYTGLIPSILAGSGSNINRGSLTITSYNQTTAAQDAAVALPATGFIDLVDNFTTTVSLHPNAAQFGFNQYNIVGRIPVIVSSIGIEKTNLLVNGFAPTLSVDTSQPIVTQSLNISGYSPLVSITSNVAITGSQYLEFLSDVIHTNVVTTADINCGELILTTFENIAAISYNANIETDSLTLTTFDINSGINYESIVGPQFLHIIGTGVIADPDAKIVDIGIQDLHLTNQAIDAGVYQRRRLALIN